eukprot:13340339-Alexandrium_andersonii.AAC.1
MIKSSSRRETRADTITGLADGCVYPRCTVSGFADGVHPVPLSLVSLVDCCAGRAARHIG